MKFNHLSRWGCGIIMLMSSARAETPLSLKDILREAVRSNLELQTISQNVPIARADVLSAKLRANPSLLIVGDIAPVPGEKFSPESKYYGASLNVPLEITRRRVYRTEAAQSSAASTDQQFHEAVRQVLYRTKLAYYSALALRDRLELARLNLNRLDSFVRLSRIRAEQEDIPAVDASRAEFTRNQYDADVRSVLTSYRASLVDLQVLMGRTEYSDSLSLQSDIEDVEAPDTLTVDEALQYALTHRPDYQSLLRQAESEKANQRLQLSLAYPDLSISGDFSRQQGTSFLGVSLNVGLPLFNRNQGEIEKSTYRAAQSDLAVRSLAASINADIQKSREEMVSLWRIVEQQRSLLLPQAEQILKTVEYSYRTGNTTLLDYLEAQRSFTELRINYIDTLVHFHVSQLNFQSAISLEENL